MTKKNDTAAAEPAANLQPSPMTYEVHHVQNPAWARAYVASQAESMTVEDLRAAAEEAQLDTGDAKTKDELVAAVRSAARGSDPTATTNSEG